MDVYNELINEMRAFAKIDENKVITYEVSSNGINLLQVRDHLASEGSILKENLSKGIYVAQYFSGIGKNPAVVGVMLDNQMLYIVSYAKEGIIKQNTAEKAAKRIIEFVK